jgi:hypothetical protein
MKNSCENLPRICQRLGPPVSLPEPKAAGGNARSAVDNHPDERPLRLGADSRRKRHACGEWWFRSSRKRAQ